MVFATSRGVRQIPARSNSFLSSSSGVVLEPFCSDLLVPGRLGARHRLLPLADNRSVPDWAPNARWTLRMQERWTMHNDGASRQFGADQSWSTRKLLRVPTPQFASLLEDSLFTRQDPLAVLLKKASQRFQRLARLNRSKAAR